MAGEGELCKVCVDEVERAGQRNKVYDLVSLRLERCIRYDRCIVTYCQTCSSERTAGATEATTSCRDCRGPWAEECQADYDTDYCSGCGIPETYVRLNGVKYMGTMRNDRTWWCKTCVEDPDIKDQDEAARKWCCEKSEQEHQAPQSKARGTDVRNY